MTAHRSARGIRPRLCGLPAAAFLMAIGLAPPVHAQARSALATDARGWSDLLRDRTLAQWVRTPMARSRSGLREGSLDEPSPWRLDASGRILTVDGGHVGHEMFRYRPELRNFVLHAEYRIPAGTGATYNAGVFFRASEDARIWHQAQAAPAGGFLLLNTLKQGVPTNLNRQEAMKENRVRPVGEWNVYEIRVVDTTVSLWVNGAVVDTYDGLEVPAGYVGLEAEGYPVEYRNIMLKRLP